MVQNLKILLSIPEPSVGFELIIEMEPTIRLERMTPSLQVRSSTTELSGLSDHNYIINKIDCILF